MSGRHLALPLEEEIVPLELRACPEPGSGSAAKITVRPQ